MISFKKWFQTNETMTSTGCVVGFSRPIGIGMVRRKKVSNIIMSQPQLKENRVRTVESKSMKTCR